MDRKDIDQESKNDFSNRVNQQTGRTSSDKVITAKFMTEDQMNSWNNGGYILIPGFVDESFCDDMNLEVLDIIKSLVPEGSAFSHAYAGEGHIAIREMKPNPDAQTIEDEISKLFRIHSTGIFNTFIKNENLFLSTHIVNLDTLFFEKISALDLQYVKKNIVSFLNFDYEIKNLISNKYEKIQIIKRDKIIPRGKFLSGFLISSAIAATLVTPEYDR